MNRRAGLALGWAWVALIVYLSVMPSPPQIPVEGGDKAGHLGLYLVAALLFSIFRKRSAAALHCLGLVALGIALEFVQRWLGYRSFEVADMVADAIGVAAGYGLAQLIPLRFSR
ncbi:MAG TPA: VanZ family protein [Burkholderiales bacterium]